MRRLSSSRPQHRRAESARRPACRPDTQSRPRYTWHGVDTNFIWQGPWGIRVNGGTSTFRANRDTCLTMLDAPNVRGREGNEFEAGCRTEVPWQTRLTGSASYNIPWVDVLVATVFQSLPGPEITATVTYDKSQLIGTPRAPSGRRHRARSSPTALVASARRGTRRPQWFRCCSIMKCLVSARRSST